MVCGGLDLTVGNLPGILPSMNSQGQIRYARELIDAVGEVVGYFKINVAFYGGVAQTDLIRTLRKIVDYIHEGYPEVPVILDAKLGDIDSTNDGYVAMVFDRIGADAVTVHNYMGRVKGMQPFLDRADKGIIVLCRTSNDGGAETQDILCTPLAHYAYQGYYASRRHFELEHGPEADQRDLVPTTPMPYYQYIAHRVVNVWNGNGNVGMVAGATNPEELRQVRLIAGDMPLLIPGIGSQGGKIIDVLHAGVNSRGSGMIINNSRDFSFAWKKSDDPEAAKQAPELAARVLRTMHDEVIANLPAAA
jgi:orotidine-5'-phosphate decarboxylase